MLNILTAPREDEDSVIDCLSRALAELRVETAKAQTFHWNVRGISFQSLHALFQTIYEDHFAAQDVLAERIKALGGHVDGRLETAVRLSAISECDGYIKCEKMVSRLALDQKILSDKFVQLSTFSEHAKDAVTSDIAIGRAQVHDQFSWMLDAHLSE